MNFITVYCYTETMASLTETAFYTRRIVKFGFLGLVAFMIFRSITFAGLRYWRQRHPEPPPAPTVSFGKLPAINFPESKTSPEGFTYQLETIAGGLPTDLGDRAKVYFIPLSSPSLLDLERAQNQAKKMGFFDQDEKINASLHRWQKSGVLNSVLTMDIVHGNFELEKNWPEDQTIFVEKMLAAKSQAIAEARSFLSQYGLSYPDLESSEAEVEYLRYVPPKIIPAISLSEADLVKVSLFRPKLDNLALLPPDPEEALVAFLFSGSRDKEKRVLAVHYTYFPIITETNATYPLKNITQAWEELKAGQAFISHYTGPEKNITIRNVYLAYFENSLAQNYLQPVYVFSGNSDFAAYVTAITSEWIE